MSNPQNQDGKPQKHQGGVTDILSDILAVLQRTEDDNGTRHLELMQVLKSGGRALSKDDEAVLAGVLASLEALEKRLSALVPKQ